MRHRTATSSTLPVDIELTLTGLDLASRNALHASVAANARRAFSRLGEPVKRVRVHVTRVVRPGSAEAWEVAVGVTLDRGFEQRVHARSAAARPHVALESALLSAWSECALLLEGPLPEPARAVA
ncbi:MAG: hypothetical protein U0324_43740 [Polyangiales bacterium]